MGTHLSRACTRTTLALVLLLLLPGAVCADLIRLKNGNEIRGRVVKESKRRVVVEVPYGQMVLDRKQIAAIEREQEDTYLRRTGEGLIQLKDFDAAVEYLREAFRKNPASEASRDALSDGLLRVAREQLHRNRLSRTQSMLAECSRLTPKNATLKELQKSLAERRDDLTAREARAAAAFAAGDVRTAHRHYRALVNTFPERRRAHRTRLAHTSLLLGHHELKSGRFDGAKAHYELALTQEPDLISALQVPLTYAHVQSVIPSLEVGRFAQARQELERALELMPGNPALLYHLALTYEGEGKLQRAAEVYGRIAGGSDNDDKHLIALRQRAENILTQSGQRVATSFVDPRWQRASGPVRVRSSRNFEIHHQNDELAAEVERHLDYHLQRLRGEWFANARLDMKKKISIFLHPNRKAFESAVNPPPWSDGVARRQQRYGVVVTQEIHFNAQAPQLLTAIVPHELCHILLPYRLGAGQPPLWLDEGLATTVEPEFKQRYFDRVVAEAKAGDELFTLESLLSSTKYPSEERVPVFYAQSNSLVRYLHSWLGKRRTMDMIARLGELSFAEALAVHTPVEDLAEFSYSWRRWLEKSQR